MQRRVTNGSIDDPHKITASFGLNERQTGLELRNEPLQVMWLLCPENRSRGQTSILEAPPSMRRDMYASFLAIDTIEDKIRLEVLVGRRPEKARGF